MKTKKIIVAGPLVKECVYPRGSAQDAPRARGAKRKMSSEAQKRMNAKYQKEKLELMLAANYLPKDLFITLTFRDADLPTEEADVDKRVKAFLRKLRRLRGKGRAPVVFWRCEHKHSDDDFLKDRRWHVHLFLNAVGGDYEMVRACWPWGDNIEIEQIAIDKTHSYAQLAVYMVKEPVGRAGAHAWHCTRNAKKPEVECFPVPDDTPLHAPKGSLVLEDVREANEYGSWRYVKYVSLAGLRPRGAARTRKRRR